MPLDEAFHPPPCERIQRMWMAGVVNRWFGQGISGNLTPGIYVHLFLAERSLEKIAQIAVHEEMSAIGAQK